MLPVDAENPRGAKAPVTDVWLIALGFALMPTGALLLYTTRTEIRDRESTALAALSGVVLFLGIAHAGTDVLIGNVPFRILTTPVLPAATAAAGVIAGLGIAYLLWARWGARASGLLTLSLAYFTVHAVADGFVLGDGFAGPYPTALILTASLVYGQLLHRFAEGALIVVPAILIGWAPRRTLGLLFIGVVTVPAVYLPIALFASPPPDISLAATVWNAVQVFVAAAEIGFAVPLIVIGLLPRVLPARGFRAAAWVAIAFLVMLLIHLMGERKGGARQDNSRPVGNRTPRARPIRRRVAERTTRTRGFPVTPYQSGARGADYPAAHMI